MLDLADIPFFSQLPSDGLDRLRQLADVRFFAAGSVICRKGEAGSTFFAVAAGGVHVQPGPEHDYSHAGISLRPGQVFGEMSLLEQAPRSASVRALEPTDCLMLSSWDFKTMLDRAPEIAGTLLAAITRRLRVADELSIH